MDLKRIIVFCAVNEHIERIKALLPSLVIFNDETDFGIASFGATNNNLSTSHLAEYVSKHGRYPNISYPTMLANFAKQQKFEFYYASPQDFLPVSRNWHCCEVLGEIAVAKHFYELGYDLVYICHNDIQFIDNFFFKVEHLMTGNWSFLAHGTRGLTENVDLQKKVFAMPSHQKINQRTRISQECIIFNRDFIKAFYNKFATEKIAWDLVFHKFSLFGDVALLDIAQEFLGYKAILVPAFVRHP